MVYAVCSAPDPSLRVMRPRGLVKWQILIYAAVAAGHRKAAHTAGLRVRMA